MSTVHVYLQSPSRISTLSRNGAPRFGTAPRWQAAAPSNVVHAYQPHTSTLRNNLAPVLRAPIVPLRRPSSSEHLPPHAYLTSPTKLSTLRRTGSAAFGPRGHRAKAAREPTPAERRDIALRTAIVELRRIVDTSTSLSEAREALGALGRQLDELVQAGDISRRA